MTDKRDLTPEEHEHLSEEIHLAHLEFHEMLHHWHRRAANPTAVTTVFCSGLLANMKDIMTPEDYEFLVNKVLSTVEMLTTINEQGDTNGSSSSVH